MFKFSNNLDSFSGNVLFCLLAMFLLYLASSGKKCLRSHLFAHPHKTDSLYPIKVRHFLWFKFNIQEEVKVSAQSTLKDLFLFLIEWGIELGNWTQGWNCSLIKEECYPLDCLHHKYSIGKNIITLIIDLCWMKISRANN